MKKFLFVACLIITQAGVAQSFSDTAAMIDKIFSKIQRNNPGCQLAISRNGVLVYSKAWGSADLEHDVTLTTESIIEAGSVSKQFTAAAVLLLEAEGKLSVDDDIRKYFPEVRDYGTPIRIQHLLHHTSGIKDWGTVAAIAGWPRTTKTYSNEDALEIIVRQRTLNNIPGAEYIYSNSNYNLLAILVQRVSGKSLAEFTRERIFIPAGMKHTQWRDDHERIVMNRAIGYEKTQTGYKTDMPNEYVYGNGGLLTTAEDLLLWNQYFLKAKLRDEKLLASQLTLVPFNNGGKNDYAAGLILDELNGEKRINHSGATAGYRAFLENFPASDLSISFLANSGETGAAFNAVHGIFFPAKKPAAASTDAAQKFTATPEKLARYIGWYRNNRSGEGYNLTVSENAMMVNGVMKISASGENVFVRGQESFTIDPGKTMLQITSTKDSILYTYVAAPTVNDDYQNEFVGNYFSEEADSRMKIYTEKGKLFCRVTAHELYELKPTYKDGFTIGGGTFSFVRDAKGKVKGYSVTSGRARNVVYERQ